MSFHFFSLSVRHLNDGHERDAGAFLLDGTASDLAALIGREITGTPVVDVVKTDRVFDFPVLNGLGMREFLRPVGVTVAVGSFFEARLRHLIFFQRIAFDVMQIIT